jgi:vacuole morphology and inheritance protein 14
VAGPLVLQYFCEIFDGLCKLAADPEKGVQDGALLLNKQLQDVVRESDVFDLERFVPLLERRIYHPQPAVRQYLIGWVKLLDRLVVL